MRRRRKRRRIFRRRRVLVLNEPPASFIRMRSASSCGAATNFSTAGDSRKMYWPPGAHTTP